MYYIRQMYRRKSNTHTLVTEKFNIVIEILLIIYKYNNSSNTSRLRESALFCWLWRSENLLFFTHNEFGALLFLRAPPSAFIELLVSVCLLTGPSWSKRNADSWVIFHNTRRKWNCRANSCYRRYVISMLKRPTQKPFQWWILDFIYMYVNVPEYKHTFKKKRKETFLCLRKMINV